MEKSHHYADRAGDRAKAQNKASEWSKIIDIVNTIPDAQATTLLIQLSRVRLIPLPTPDIAPQVIEEKIRSRARELESLGMHTVANAVLSALSQI